MPARSLRSMNDPKLDPSRSFGRYEPSRTIGGTSRHDILLALDADSGAEVVLKAAAPRLRGARRKKIVRGLELERDKCLHVAHARVLPPIDFVATESECALVLPYCPGGDLRARVRTHGPLAIETLAPILEDACEALVAMHDGDLIHLDVNPQNVLIDGDGRGVLIDLGIAKDIRQALPIRHLGGSPGYMSPEQSGSIPFSISTRSDVFSLGVSVYELISGRKAFRCRGRDDYLVTLARDTPPPLAEVAQIAQPISDVVERAMSYWPPMRHPDVPSFRAAFRAALAEVRSATPNMELSAAGEQGK